MRAEWVIDASVIGAAFFEEDGTAVARAFLTQDDHFVAPDLLTIELASIAAKKVWRGLTTVAVGEKALADLSELVTETTCVAFVAHRAFLLAAQHRFSAYDASYLALAETRQIKVATLDGKLVRRAEQAGFAHLVHALA